MRVTGSVAAVAASLAAVQVGAQAPPTSDYTAEQIANGDAFRNITQIVNENMQYSLSQRANQACTYENADLRMEWRTMDQDTRKSFTDAVICLQNTPPQRMTADEAPNYPGVKSRYDEYVATHINYTNNIHVTADFFAWHRTFIHFLEKDLQGTCGYTGKLPYWNWADDAEAPQNSPLFSGDEYSMGSNGEYVPGRSDTYLGGGFVSSRLPSLALSSPAIARRDDALTRPFCRTPRSRPARVAAASTADPSPTTP